MERLSASPLTGMHADQPSVGGTPSQGRWLILARGMWLILVVFTIGLYIVSVPVKYQELLQVCMPLHCNPMQLSPADMPTFRQLHLSFSFYATYNLSFFIGFTLVFALIAAVIFWQRSDDRVGLFVSFTLMMYGASFPPVIEALAVAQPVWRLPAFFVQDLALFCVMILAFLFPDGHFVPRWLVSVAMLFALWCLIRPFFIPSTPFSTEASTLSLRRFENLLGVCLYSIGTFAQLYRYMRGSNPVQRQQSKWAMFGLTIMLLGLTLYVFLHFAFLPLTLPGLVHVLDNLISLPSLIVVPGLLFPLTIGIAILRYRLWDIDILINRTLVYGVLTVSIVALYIAVVVGLGALFQAQGNLAIALLATGLVAVLFQPLRNHLQRSVNRLMYGDRDEPYRVLTRLGKRLEATLAPEAVLPTIVEMVALALKLPYAAIALLQGETSTPAVSFGALREGEKVVRLPLVAQNEAIGELVLAPRTPGESFTPADQRLLEDLSRQIGVAVYAVRLTADLKRLTIDLQRSRERLVTAREEERRRLRRDLHDGLGPQLASLTLKLETARNRLAHDPLADTLLSDLTQRTQATVADIRRLVYALRPPALDELGLLSALHELTLLSSDQVSMRLAAPTGLPELPAAVEVAVYRIAQEALTNVVRHAAAQHCDLRLALDKPAGWLSLSIQDDGCGLSPSRSMGVGLVSMRERAEELGGTWTIEQVPTGGTCILAWLPYARSKTADPLDVTPSAVGQEEE